MHPTGDYSYPLVLPCAFTEHSTRAGTYDLRENCMRGQLYRHLREKLLRWLQDYAGTNLYRTISQ